jgi:hypothetical protein
MVDPDLLLTDSVGATCVSKSIGQSGTSTTSTSTRLW